jgi:hypothetical protein
LQSGLQRNTVKIGKTNPTIVTMIISMPIHHIDRVRSQRFLLMYSVARLLADSARLVKAAITAN